MAVASASLRWPPLRAKAKPPTSSWIQHIALSYSPQAQAPTALALGRGVGARLVHQAVRLFLFVQATANTHYTGGQCDCVCCSPTLSQHTFPFSTKHGPPGFTLTHALTYSMDGLGLRVGTSGEG